MFIRLCCDVETKTINTKMLYETINEEQIYKDIGERLKLFRVMKKVSQSVAGEQVGVTFQQIQKYEGGTNRTPISKLYMLAIFYGVPLAAILGIDAPVISTVQDLTILEIRIIACLRKMNEREAKAITDLIFNIVKI